MWVKATLGAGVGMAHYFGVAVVTQNAGLREVEEVLDGLGHSIYPRRNLQYDIPLYNGEGQFILSFSKSSFVLS